jgi:hypothetical protein
VRIEEGFRRITLVIAVGIFCLALLPPAAFVFKMWSMERYDNCSKEAWSAVSKDRFYADHPDRALVYVSTRCGTNPLEGEAGGISSVFALGVLGVAWTLQLTGAVHWAPESWFARILMPTGMCLMVLAIGVFAAGLLALLPWALFRLLRWIGHGFAGAA